MTTADAAILDYCASLGRYRGVRPVVTPGAVVIVLVDELGVVTVAPSTVRRRMALLAERGFLERVGDRPYYRITQPGLVAAASNP